jgi:aminoacyl tRNA synthase complex-interacting multifunctional protein 1
VWDRFLKKQPGRQGQDLVQAATETAKGSESQDQGGVSSSSARLQEILVENINGQGKDMSQPGELPEPPSKTSFIGGHDKPLVVGRTKPTDSTTTAKDSSRESAALSAHIKSALSAMEVSTQDNARAAAPAEADPTTTNDTAPTTSSKPTTKKEKAPKQPKQPKATPPSAPLSPALLDLRVGHILRCVTHPNADSLFVSTIAMGDEEGADNTHTDEETGKIVRTVCSGLNGLIPLEEMQDRKIVVVANLKPVTMRGIKSAAMVLAASPRVADSEDDHAPDRTVELVMPPANSEAGDKVSFEGWPYGDGRGPEKQLNPKKKVWEAIQPGFYTNEELVVGFDASASEAEGQEKGDLVVEGKGKCTVKTLKGAVVR